jgi:hypothetical protein
MYKFISFFKKYWIFIFISLAGILYVASLLIKTPEEDKTSAIDKTASFESLTPGISNKGDVNTLLGKPLSSTTSGLFETSEYKSSVEMVPNVGYFINDKLSLLKRVVPAKEDEKSSSIISIYGTATNILFSKTANSTFDLYVYPSNGIAYLGHSDGTLLEVWYFQPTTIKDFIEKYGQDYSTNKPVDNTLY